MHKRIEPHQVELGMYIHKLEGRWTDHPFWRARFLLEDNERLEKLRASAIPAVIIDTSRGRDVADTNHGEQPQRPPTAAERLASRPRTRAPVVVPDGAVRETGNLRSAPPQSMAREFGQAVSVAERSKKVVSRVFLKVRLGKDFKASMVEPVIEDIFLSVSRNAHAFNGLMRCKQDNEPIYRHTLANSALMISLGRQLRLPHEQLRQAGMAGLLLDVGLAQLPMDLSAIDHDFSRIPTDIYESHVDLGYQFCTASGVPDPVATAVHEHHERMDGRGYPQRLKRAEISLLGRMAAVCDSYDDLCNGGDGKHGLDPGEALARMSQMPGAFDPEIFQAFTEALGIYPVGTVLLLRSGRLALVVDQNPAEPQLPRVICFFSTISGHKTPPEAIDLATCGGTEAIEAIASPQSYGIVDFEALREKLFNHACLAMAA